MNKISAVVITLNEEHNIRECLESLSFVSEIVVVDSGSEDNTVSIAREFTSKVYMINWPGYAEAKNFGIDKAAHDWIFSLDADERVSPELVQAVNSLDLEQTDISGYQISRRTWYLSRWIKGSGWYPDRGIRLFNRNSGRFSEVPVHESVNLNDIPGELTGDILHFSYRDLSDHFKRINKYSKLCAKQWKSKGRHPSSLAMILRPGLEFFRKLILRRGYTDGFEGFIIAGMHAIYVFMKYAYLYELYLEDKTDRKDSY